MATLRGVKVTLLVAGVALAGCASSSSGSGMLGASSSDGAWAGGCVVACPMEYPTMKELAAVHALGEHPAQKAKARQGSKGVCCMPVRRPTCASHAPSPRHPFAQGRFCLGGAYAHMTGDEGVVPLARTMRMTSMYSCIPFE